MRRRTGLLYTAILATLASGFSSSPKTFPPQRAHMHTKPTTVRPRPVAAAAAGETRASAVIPIRGGGAKDSSTQVSATGGAKYLADQNAVSSGSECPVSFLASAWGSGGVAYILIKAILRILPIALEPFVKGGGEVVAPLTSFQLALYVGTSLWFAYVEGYKGFQKKFSPLVVSRSRTLVVGTSSYLHIFLAPLYSMGLFHATKKRVITSWSVTIGVAGIVAAVKRLPYPWRNIVDAGVVVGLTWGTLSIFFEFAQALMMGKSPSDPALPGSEKKK